MKKNAGFTLVELMIGLVIAAILLTVAVPAFTTFIQNNRVTSQANELVTALNLARSEAVGRGSSISVCPSSDGATCTGGTDWAIGWIVVRDSANSGAVSITGTPLRIWGSLAGGSTLSGPAFVRFLSTGGAGAGTAPSFSLSIPDCTGDLARAVQINAAGRVQATPASC